MSSKHFLVSAPVPDSWLRRDVEYDYLAFATGSELAGTRQ